MKKYSLEKYSHAYDFSFEVESYTEDASDVTPAMIRTALVARARRLSDTEIPEACGVYDSGEVRPHIYDQGTIAVVSDELIARKANARLMATAPELLAAARHLLPRARRAQRLSKADMLLLESVIAKATQP